MYRRQCWGRSRAGRLLPAAIVAAAASLSHAHEARAQIYVPSPEAQYTGITAWWDSVTGTEYVFYVCGDQAEIGGGEGNICVVTCGAGGCWVAPDAGGDPSYAPNAITDTGGLTSAQYWSTGTFQNTTQFWGGQLTGFFDSNTQGYMGHVYFSGWRIDPSNRADPFAASRVLPHLFEFAINGASRWITTDLTAATGATTPYATNLTDAAADGGDALFGSLSSLSADGFEHVFYLGQADTAVHDTYYNAGWQDRAVTPSLTYLNPPYYGAGLTSYFDGSAMHVVTTSQEYYASDTCYFFDGLAFSCSYSNSTPWWTGWMGSGLSGFLASTGSGPPDYTYYTEVFGETGIASAQVNILSDAAGNWEGRSNALTLPNYDVNNPSLQYTDPYYVRTFYVGGDQHIYGYDGGGAEDLMPQSGGPNAAYSNSAAGDDALTQLAGFFDGNYDHVFYIAVDGHVHELYNPTPWQLTGGWYSNDLNLSARATSPGQLPFMP